VWRLRGLHGRCAAAVQWCTLQLHTCVHAEPMAKQAVCYCEAAKLNRPGGSLLVWRGKSQIWAMCCIGPRLVAPPVCACLQQFPPGLVCVQLLWPAGTAASYTLCGMSHKQLNACMKLGTV
jgi:hypothetical protein